MWPSAIADSMRPGVTSMILALPCTESVITPACDPVKERALKPRSEIAIASTAIEIRSPAVSSMSSSRAGGSGLTSLARSSSSSVVSPIAETATTTSWPCFLTCTIRRATRLTAAASETDEPPYFCTTMPTARGYRGCRRRPGPATERGRLLLRADSSTCSATSMRSISSGSSASESRRSWATIESSALRTAPAEVAPRGDVGELPPPQRLGDVARAVVAQPVLEVGGDAGEVVGDLALHHLGHVRVEDVGVGVDAAEHLGQAQPHLLDVGLRADVGLELTGRLEVLLDAEPGAGEHHLADLEQQQRDRRARRPPRGRWPAARAGSSTPSRRSAARSPRSRRRWGLASGSDRSLRTLPS